MAAFTYPGVYIEEISSGQHTITGVATSIASFIGWANQGPVGKAVMVESWPEYQATFGGMIPGIYLGYAVYQFFLNGGSQAYIIRLVDTNAETATSMIGGLVLYASSPGVWGNNIGVSITKLTTSGTVSTFNLQVTMLSPSGTPSTLESYTNLSTSTASSQYAVTVINSDSNYISFTPPGGSPPSSITVSAVTATIEVIAGSITGTTAFTAGETVKQSVTGATATLLGTVNGSYLVLSSVVTGTANSSGTWTGETSTATFAPTSAPVSSTSIPLSLGAGTVKVGADGTQLIPSSADAGGDFETQLNGANGFALLNNVPIFNLLCVPGEASPSAIPNLLQCCATNRAFLIVDSPQTSAASVQTAVNSLTSGPVDSAGTSLAEGAYITNSAFYFPWVTAPDPQVGFRPTQFPPCGFVAGIYASTDASRGVWKAPAGIDAGLNGALGLQYVLTDLQNGSLNQVGVNCLRQFPIYGNVVWGARTIAGADALGSQWKYVPIRRLALFLESSLYAGTQWAVFEPNAEPLWGQVRLSIGTFMQGLFLQGAFAGTTPQQAYFVKCDGDNNPDSSVAMGILNITVGFAPLYPAEFVVIKIQQLINQS
jgi:phage tail sheath protein FI